MFLRARVCVCVCYIIPLLTVTTYSCTFVLHCLLIHHNPPVLFLGWNQWHYLSMDITHCSSTRRGQMGASNMFLFIAPESLLILQHEGEHRKGCYKMVCLCPRRLIYKLQRLIYRVTNEAEDGRYLALLHPASNFLICHTGNTKLKPGHTLYNAQCSCVYAM